MKNKCTLPESYREQHGCHDCGRGSVISSDDFEKPACLYPIEDGQCGSMPSAHPWGKCDKWKAK